MNPKGRKPAVNILAEDRSSAPTLGNGIPLLNSASYRYSVYALCGLLLFLAALGSVTFKKKFNFVVSDGRGYYVYLPSLFIDGSLDCSNQIKHHWDVDFNPTLLESKTEKGYVRNKYPIGPALTLVPSFLIAHGLTLGLHFLSSTLFFTPDGYSAVYQTVNLFFLLFLGTCSLILNDNIIIAHYQISGPKVAAGIIIFWLGSPFLYYFFREPFMAHLVSGFWVSLCIWLIHSILIRLRKGELVGWQLLVLTFSFSMALVCRPTNVFLFPFFAYLGLAILQAKMVGRLVSLIPLAMVGLCPLVIQSFIWHRTSGHWLHYSYEGESFYWARPALWQTLFSSRHGLFFWSPLFALSVWGVVRHLIRENGWRKPFSICFFLAFLILWYLNSSWYCWWFGDAFGGRAFLEIGSFFVLGMVLVFRSLDNARSGMRWAVWSFVATSVVFNTTLMALYITHKIPRGDYLF